MDVIHKGAGRDGSDTNAPTTFLVDGQGQVKCFSRAGRVTERLVDEPSRVMQRMSSLPQSLGDLAKSLIDPPLATDQRDCDTI